MLCGWSEVGQVWIRSNGFGDESEQFSDGLLPPIVKQCIPDITYCVETERWILERESVLARHLDGHVCQTHRLPVDETVEYDSYRARTAFIKLSNTFQIEYFDVDSYGRFWYQPLMLDSDDGENARLIVFDHDRAYVALEIDGGTTIFADPRMYTEPDWFEKIVQDFLGAIFDNFI